MTQRKPLGRIGRVLARSPQPLFRVGLEWLLGNRFVMVEHVGRVSGLPRQTVLEVIRHDAQTIDVAAAWGPRSDWFRNLIANPSAVAWIGRRRGVPVAATVVDVDTATAVFDSYRHAHPLAASGLGRALGLDFDRPAQVAAAVPVVRLTLSRRR